MCVLRLGLWVGGGAWMSLETFIDKVELGVVVTENGEGAEPARWLSGTARVPEAGVRVYKGGDKVSFPKALDTCSWTVGRKQPEDRSSRARGTW